MSNIYYTFEDPYWMKETPYLYPIYSLQQLSSKPNTTQVVLRTALFIGAGIGIGVLVGFILPK